MPTTLFTSSIAQLYLQITFNEDYFIKSTCRITAGRLYFQIHLPHAKWQPEIHPALERKHPGTPSLQRDLELTLHAFISQHFAGKYCKSHWVKVLTAGSSLQTPSDVCTTNE